MKRFFLTFISILLLCSACQFKLKTGDEKDDSKAPVEVARFDRLEYRYLTTGDFSALQQMSTEYPIETRTLIEKVVHIGKMSDPEINGKFLNFYQDTTLQSVLAAVQSQYATMDDINAQFTEAFHKLKTWLPDLHTPLIYAQISAFDQSVIIGDNTVGISLDKYLGADYPAYAKFYSEDQRQQMTRENILPDCLSFYLISLYGLADFDTRNQDERDLHVGKIQWVVNHAMGKNFYQNQGVQAIDLYMQKHHDVSVKDLLEDTDYGKFRKS